MCFRSPAEENARLVALVLLLVCLSMPTARRQTPSGLATSKRDVCLDLVLPGSSRFAPCLSLHANHPEEQLVVKLRQVLPPLSEMSASIWYRLVALVLLLVCLSMPTIRRNSSSSNSVRSCHLSKNMSASIWYASS